MKRFFPASTLMLLLLLGLTLAGAQEIEREPLPPVIIISGSPATPDMIEMLTKYNDPQYNWDNARGVIWGYKFYAGNLSHPSPWNTGSNNFTTLQRHNVFRSVTRNLKLNASIEAGAIKPQDCLVLKKELEASAERAVVPVRNVLLAGGNISDVAIDTATINCRYSKGGAGRRVGEWSVLVEQKAFAMFNEVRSLNPDALIIPLGIGDIEPYPAVTAVEHITYINAMTIERARQGFGPILFYDFDVDTRFTGSDEQVIHDFDVMIAHLHSLNIRVGIILNGDDSKLSNPQSANHDTLRSANRKLMYYRRLGLFRKVDRLIIQSWAFRDSGDPKNPIVFDIPYNVPERELSLTWFLNHVVGCIQRTESCEFPFP